MSKYELLVRSIKRRGFINSMFYAYYELAFDLIHKTDTKPEIENLDSTAQNSDYFSSPHQGASPWIFKLCIKELVKLGLDIQRASFLDIGSGKGRVMILSLLAGFERVFGVEFDPDLCDVARRNIETIQGRLNASRQTIFNADAACFTPPEGLSVVFMYNPFGTIMMRQVLNNLITSHHKHDCKTFRDPLYIIYVNPVYSKVFDEFNLVPLKEVVNEALIYKIE